MTYSEFKNELKNGLKSNVYIFSGEEDFLKDYCISEAKKALIAPDFEDFNYKEYKDNLDYDAVSSFLEAVPVMSDKKLIVFRKSGLFENGLKGKDQWAQMFNDVAPFNCIIIFENEVASSYKRKSDGSAVAKEAKKNGVVVEFPYQMEAKLKVWINNIVTAQGKEIDGKDISYIIASVGRSMVALKSEMNKIIAHTEEKKIKREDIDAVIVKPLNDKVFTLVDALFDGHRQLCYQSLYTLREMQNEPVAVLSVLCGQIINIYKAKVLLDNGETKSSVTSALGGGYGAEKAVSKAQKSNIANLELLIKLCKEADRDIKCGLIDPWAALEMIIAKYKAY